MAGGYAFLIAISYISYLPNTITSLLKPGTFFILQGAFYFKRLNDKYNGTGQNILGYRKAKGIRVEFEFDGWFCNSSSSKSHLSGRSVVTAYCICRYLLRKGNELIVRATVVAIGTGFEPILEGRYDFYEYINEVDIFENETDVI